MGHYDCDNCGSYLGIGFGHCENCTPKEWFEIVKKKEALEKKAEKSWKNHGKIFLKNIKKIT